MALALAQLCIYIKAGKLGPSLSAYLRIVRAKSKINGAG